MTTLILSARPTIWLTALLAALGPTSLAAKSAGATPLESADGVSPTAVVTALQWNFQVGNVFHISEEAATSFIDATHHAYRNEVELLYSWHVTDVAPDGTATLVVIPESVEIHSQFALAQGDAVQSNFAIAPTEELKRRAQLLEARTSAQTRLGCRVTNKGQVVRMWSALPAAETIRLIGFTPAMFARLPAGAVQLGDSWHIESSQDTRIDDSRPVSALYRLVDCWCKTDRDVLHVEGSIAGSAHSGQQVEFGPMISVSHFDPINEFFTDQIIVTSGEIHTGLDEIVTFRFIAKRNVTKIAEPPATRTTQLPDTLRRQ